MKFHQKYHFGTLAYRRGSNHDEDIYEALKFQTRQSGAPFQNTNSQLTIQLTLCWTITNRNLDRTMEKIGQTTTTKKKWRVSRRLEFQSNIRNQSQPHPQHDTWHINTGKPIPSDNCPFTLNIISQNANCLGGRNDNKMGKNVSLVIDRNINAYCLQRKWQICDYMLTIWGYTVFHHGMNEKPQRKGQTSAGVMIILSPDLTRAWTRAGKFKPITSPPIS